MGISLTGGHVSVVLFADNPVLEIKLSEFYDVVAFNSAVDRLPYNGGGTRIDKALNFAYNDMFNVANGMRTTVPKTVILMTDGQNNLDDWTPPQNVIKTDFDNAGIKIIVIGIGSNVKDVELLELVDDPSNFLKTDNFSTLTSDEFVNKIASCSILSGR